MKKLLLIGMAFAMTACFANAQDMEKVVIVEHYSVEADQLFAKNIEHQKMTWTLNNNQTIAVNDDIITCYVEDSAGVNISAYSLYVQQLESDKVMDTYLVNSKDSDNTFHLTFFKLMEYTVPMVVFKFEETYTIYYGNLNY